MPLKNKVWDYFTRSPRDAKTHRCLKSVCNACGATFSNISLKRGEEHILTCEKISPEIKELICREIARRTLEEREKEKDIEKRFDRDRDVIPTILGAEGEEILSALPKKKSRGNFDYLAPPGMNPISFFPSITPAEQNAADSHLLRWFATANIPLSSLKDANFLKFCEALRPNYTPPSAGAPV